MTWNKNGKKKVLIIGGGAAGMACAVFLARSGAEVTVAERNEKTGKKLYITGKGRCNFTNASGPEEFLNNVVSNRKFLYSAAYGFTSSDAIRFFEDMGLKTKTERGNRAFPLSDHSSDVIKALNNEMKKLGVRVMLDTRIASVEKNGTGAVSEENGETGSIDHAVTEKGEILKADHFILATGGLSYPSTGSTGDGFRFAKELGIGVTDTYPSLTSITVEEKEIPESLEGLSLRNVALSVKDGKKELFSAFGEMLFTRNGISGPIVLSASARLVKKLDYKKLRAYIDLKPALSPEQLDARILREFEKGKNRRFVNAVSGLFPASLLPVIVSMSGIDPEKPANSVTRAERISFAELIKHFPMTLSGHGGYNEAVITQGGISVKYVDPHTMRVRGFDNLYAVGEVLDVDALTGGFNLQIAWSTAYLAAEAIADKGEIS